MTTYGAKGSPKNAHPHLPFPPPPFPPLPHPRRTVFQGTGLERVEDAATYAPGGHYPVHLGDVVGSKYKVIHKLGNGGFALVWLARDVKKGRCVALKILRADAPPREALTLEYLKTHTTTNRIAHLQETFMVQGPNGIHQCLVLDVGGPSLEHLILYCKRLPLPFRIDAARNLTEGLATLHSAGICHGDLTHSNVLFQIKGLHDWTEDEIYRYLGPPKTKLLLLLDGTPAPAFAPTHLVDALDYSNLDVARLSSNILIVDFGEAFSKDNVPPGLGTPVSFSGPELAFGYPPSYAVDLWALGCLIFEIYTSRQLLPTAFGSEEELISMATETIGALPEEWRNSYYNKEISLEPISGEKHRWFDAQIERAYTLDSRISKHMPELSQDQHATLVQLLRSIMVFAPSQRLPSAEVRKYAWFTGKS
ncbi:kinase-like protein [Tothia fuscella]|uniref:EKC/KEOPS complex subunit BUD32 n=1 Tax=Tothia fuscella TaxID=1048955 RepID=A0A9P4NWB4_9PEZI|nr:kinase-like protein [Tothia fuscella]